MKNILYILIVSIFFVACSNKNSNTKKINELLDLFKEVKPPFECDLGIFDIKKTPIDLEYHNYLEKDSVYERVKIPGFKLISQTYFHTIIFLEYSDIYPEYNCATLFTITKTGEQIDYIPISWYESKPEGEKYALTKFISDTEFKIISFSYNINTNQLIDSIETDFSIDENGKINRIADRIILQNEDFYAQNTDPHEVVESFINALGSQNYSEAYYLTENPKWGTLEKFSSPKAFGGITETQLRDIYTKENDVNYAIIFAEVNYIDPTNGDKIFAQEFYLKLIDNEWKITDLKVLETINETDFNAFLELFDDKKLPINVDEMSVKNIISLSLYETFILPYCSESKESDEIKTICKFKIEDKYWGCIYHFYTNTSGDIKELLIFDLQGKFISQEVVEVDYRSYRLTSKIDAMYNITTNSYDNNSEENADIETEKYSIINGKIIKK